MWKHLTHPNIVPLLGVTVSPFQLISTWMSGGDLPGYIEKNPSVIVMTFWYVFWNGLSFFELFNFHSSLGIDHDPPCSLCLFPFPYVSFFTRSHGQEKSLSYYDLLYDFGVLFYGRTPTLIFFFLLHNPTTPILPVYVDQRWPHLEKDTTRSRSVVIR